MRSNVTRRLLAGVAIVAFGGVSACWLHQKAPRAGAAPTNVTLPSRTVVATRVDSIVERFLANNGPSGLSVAIVRGADTLVMKGWGLADRGANRPAAAATSYRVGSITKQFTAAAVLRMVDRGRVTLRDTIGRFVPQLPVRWRGVTVEQLLEHTSGVPDYTAIGDRWTRAWKDSVTPQALIALVNGAKGELDFRPGTAWSYSNMGYDVLGLLVETLYAKPFADVIRDEFAVPLGLVATRFCENAAGANGQALGYARTGARFETAPYQHISHAFADGSLCTTVGDLDRWNRALHGGRVVSAASYARMITPAGSAVQANYGLGVKAIARPEHPIIYHQGQMPGFVSIDAWFPGDSLSVVVLANDDAWPGLAPLLNALAPIALGIPL